MSGFKVVNTTSKGQLVAIELRHDGQITPNMRDRLRGHAHVLRVIPGNNPSKLYILTAIPNYAKNNELRAAFVDTFNQMAHAAR